MLAGRHRSPPRFGVLNMRKIPRAKLLMAVIVAGFGVVILVLLAIRVPRAIEYFREVAMVRRGTRELGMKLLIYATTHQDTWPATLAEPGFAGTLSPNDHLLMQAVQFEYTPPVGKRPGVVKVLVGHSRAGTSTFFSDGHTEYGY
jgi:hypothetical protein